MRLVRALCGGLPRWAEVDGEWLLWLEGSFEAGFRSAGAREPLAGVVLLAPVTPSKIVAMASNYASHAAEMGKPVPTTPRIFLKAPSAVIGPEAAIVLPPGTDRVDPEGELAVVIGRRLTRASPEEAMRGIFGFTAANDVTARDIQKADGLFSRAKGFDSFCPIGPWVVTGLDAADLGIETRVNGEVRAAGRTSEMVFDLPTQLAFISNVMTLEPGDVVLTGTPPGVAPIQAGDRVEVWIEGIGVLANPVRDRDDR